MFKFHDVHDICFQIRNHIQNSSFYTRGKKGDNCTQNCYLVRYILDLMAANFLSCRAFMTMRKQHTSQDDNFQYSYSHSYAINFLFRAVIFYCQQQVQISTNEKQHHFMTSGVSVMNFAVNMAFET